MFLSYEADESVRQFGFGFFGNLTLKLTDFFLDIYVELTHFTNISVFSLLQFIF